MAFVCVLLSNWNIDIVWRVFQSVPRSTVTAVTPQSPSNRLVRSVASAQNRCPLYVSAAPRRQRRRNLHQTLSRLVLNSRNTDRWSRRCRGGDRSHLKLHRHPLEQPPVAQATESFATCSCFSNLSHCGKFACRLHRYECTHV